MTTLVQLTMSGLALGAAYALVALGFVVIYRASRIFNFAHGELLAVGAFLMASLVDAGLPWAAALLVAMATTGILAALLERIFLRPLVARPVFASIILTLFLGVMVRTANVAAFGHEPRGMPTPWEPTTTADIFGASVFWSSLGAIAAGVLALGLYLLLAKTTRLGVAMRATASDQESALALGIPVGRIFGWTWFIAGAYAALAGVFVSMFPHQLDSHVGFVALRAFPAVIVGGLESVGGTIAAGVLLGLLEVLSQGYVNPHLGSFGQNFHTVFPYVAMIVFLVVRPYGLFGQRIVERL